MEFRISAVVSLRSLRPIVVAWLVMMGERASDLVLRELLEPRAAGARRPDDRAAAVMRSA